MRLFVRLFVCLFVRLLWLLLSTWLAGLYHLAAAQAGSEPTQPPDPARGKILYRNGWNGQSGCARCHGWQGEGQTEGGIQAAPLRDNPVVTQPHALQQALVAGIGSQGVALHPLMPRYPFDAATLADLQAYLAQVGSTTDADPGISPASLRVASLLPPTSTAASVQTVLAAEVAKVNALGGIYGRRLELVINPPPQEPIFAWLANMQAPPPDTSTTATTSTPSPPSIGPLTGSTATASGSGREIFYLESSPLEQARVMLDHASQSSGSTGALTLIHDPTLTGEQLEMIAALRSQAALRQRLLLEYVYPLPAEPIGPMIFLGSPAHLLALAGTTSPLPIYALASTAGDAVFALPPTRAARLRLAFGWALAQPGTPGTHAPQVAQAALAVLVEALKRNGRQLDRARFLRTLENLREFPTASLGRISFSPNQHHASHGAQIVGVDVVHAQYTVLSNWLLPQTREK